MKSENVLLLVEADKLLFGCVGTSHMRRYVFLEHGATTKLAGGHVLQRSLVLHRVLYLIVWRRVLLAFLGPGLA